MSKLIFLLFVPIISLLSSCSVKCQVDLCPASDGVPNKPSPIKEITGSYRDGTDGWKVIDKDFTRLA